MSSTGNPPSFGSSVSPAIFDNGWNVSAGYTYVESAVPDQGLLPIVPDSDRHFFALGVGRDYGNFYWQATYQYTYADERGVSGN